MVMVKRQKKGGIIVRKTVVISKNLNGILPSALTIEVGLILAT